MPKTAVEYSAVKNVLCNLPGGWASFSTHSPHSAPSSTSPSPPSSPSTPPSPNYSPSPQPCLSLATSQITVCSPVPNRPPLRRPTGYPTSGERRVEKRQRIEVSEAGEVDTVDEGGDAEVTDAGKAVDAAGDITELQVLQRYK